MTVIANNIDEYKLAFALVRGMGVELASRILDVIPSERDFFTIPRVELERISGSRSRVLSEEYRNQKLEAARRQLDELARTGVQALYFRDENYPKRLLNAADAPILLFGVGNCDLNAPHIVSIVGTRHATHHGMADTEMLVSGIAERLPGTVIVSGLAYGIDVAAHTAALKNNLPTIGVVAHGLDMIYPAAHRGVASSMARSGGALLSEYPLGARLHRSNFLARNRIIAALADCTVVVESAAHGGALVTAAIADSYNRDVLAFPGRASDEYSAGCNNLIRRNKAQLITGVDDLMQLMQWESAKSADHATQMSLFHEYTPQEQQVVDFLTREGESHVNLIAATMSMRVHEMMNILIDMEFKGYVHAVPGGKYSV